MVDSEVVVGLEVVVDLEVVVGLKVVVIFVVVNSGFVVNAHVVPVNCYFFVLSVITRYFTLFCNTIRKTNRTRWVPQDYP